MKAKNSPNAGVFEDKRRTKPVSPRADQGYAEDSSGNVKLLTRVRIMRKILWVEPILIPALLNLQDRQHAA